MSLESWKEKFYPIPANQVPIEDALNHSIRKWEGLSPENLAEHGMRIGIRSIKDGKIELSMDTSSCALCFHHEGPDCPSCPLALSRKGVRCDLYAHNESISPYSAFIVKGDHAPMLEALKKAKEFIEKEKRS